jgi:MerR family transcriptional regulator, light-induced transcriptional regulator
MPCCLPLNIIQLMGQYSIKELEKLSGIKAHTIRIWEKRHHIVEPQRTDTNIRYYSDEDLKKIINVSLLNNHGIKISRIADMSADEIHKKILELSEQKAEADIFIDQLIVAMMDMDEVQFEEVISKLSDRFGFEKTITGTVYPFLEKIGVLWQTGNITPAHEHFITNLIRQKIISAIAALRIPPKTAPRALLFLPEGELHELGLLFYHYLVRQKGFYTFYLGQSVPYNDLKEIYAIHRPAIMVTSLISTPQVSELQGFMNTLSTDFPDCIIFASGLTLRKTAFVVPKNVKSFYKASELPALLESIRH